MENYLYSWGKKYQMRPLIDLINEVYLDIKGDLPYPSVQSFIKDDTKSLEFIRSILHDDIFERPDDYGDLHKLAKARARHSAVTFLIGLTLFKYLDFEGMILSSSYIPKSTGRKAIDYLWMITALYHDYGYFTKDVKNREIDCKSKVKYYLLNDSYTNEVLKVLQQFSAYHSDVLAYTYDEIEEYDVRSRQLRQDREDYDEQVDHGILGGIYVFDWLIKKTLKNVMTINKNELIAIKTGCLTIAQHNIFKSESKTADMCYGPSLRKLHSTSKFIVNSSTPLLLLLSLVDTFECVKKLSRGENPKQSLKTITVLSSISLYVSQEEMVIDFSKLDERISEKNGEELKKTYKNYKENLLKLSNWTSFIVDNFDYKVIKIRMDYSKDFNNRTVTEDEYLH